MTIGIGFLKVDLIIQRILLVIYFIAGLGGFFLEGLFLIAMLTQFVIGAWQVLSSIIFNISGNKRRIIYFVTVVCFFILLVCGYVLIEQGVFPESIILSIIGMVIVPMSMATWYQVITVQHYNDLSRNPKIEDQLKLNMEDILDSDELYS